MTPGRKFSTTTSDAAISLPNTSRPFLLLRLMVIERARACAAVLRQNRGADPSAIEGRIGAELTREVAGARHLDLDHVGAELCELVAAERPGQDIGQIEDARAGQKSAHRCSRALDSCLFCVIELYSVYHSHPQGATSGRRGENEPGQGRSGGTRAHHCGRV